MKILVSTSATARQQSNAKSVFGSKSVSILKALEEASKEKTLSTPGLDAFLADLKLSGEAFEEVSSKAAFTKAVAAAKAFVSAKTFTAKIAALKSLKYSPRKSTDEVTPAYKHKASKKPETGLPVPPASETSALKSNNIDHLYNQLQDLTSVDYTTDLAVLKHVIGESKVIECGLAADPYGQLGIHIVCKSPVADVYIINKHEAPKTFKSLAAKALQANPKATYLICADRSDDGLFYSTKLKTVRESIKLFGPTDSTAAFDHLKRLCN